MDSIVFMKKELEVGDIAPNFRLPAVLSGTFELREEVKRGPVLLYFYVVNYGQTCTDYMALMNERRSELDALNVRMVHINPETVENHRQWMDRTDALFDHLSDEGQKISKEYGAIVERARSDKILGYTNREFFLVDRDMRIRYIWRAHWPTDTLPMAELLAEIKNTLEN